MKVPCCSICQMRCNEEERIPLLLQCGHDFCKECLSHMFSTSPDTTLSCPRCRHLSMIGNSVHTLRKNFAVLALINSSSSSTAFDCDFTDVDSDDADLDDDKDEFSRCRRSRNSYTSSSGCNAGVEMWLGVLSGGLSSSSLPASGRCRHRAAVKKLRVGEYMDMVWVQSQLEKLRRMLMWCKNVCTFHGATRMDGRLCLIMDRYSGSVQSQMQQNEGRLTVEQILRVCIGYLKRASQAKEITEGPSN